MKKFLVKTLGCKANFSDGQKLEAGLRDLGFSSTHDLDQAALVIVNSCTVTDEADKQSQKMVQEIRKKNPSAKIVYTGCGAEVNPDQALQIPGVSAVIGNQNKHNAAELISNYVNESTAFSPAEILGSVSNYSELISRHPMDREWPMPDPQIDDLLKLDEGSSTHRTRAFIKIQEGCDSFCTYCIIPYGRGPARSLPISTIVEQISKLVDHGIREVILTGTNIGDYGLDWSGQLQIDSLIEAILTQTRLPRLRVSSLDPTEISNRLIELAETYPAFCPHFHVSLQHVSSKILKLMKRKYSFNEVKDTLDRLSQMARKPFVGMDFITGFPGETEADFNATVEILKGLYWQRLHVFPYSEREGTPATRLPGVVPHSERKRRAKALQALSLERMTRYFSETRRDFENESGGTLQGVLLENFVKGPDGTRNWISGYSPNYQRVLLPVSSPEKAMKNEIIDVKVSHWVVDRALGEVSWLGELQ